MKQLYINLIRARHFSMAMLLLLATAIAVLPAKRASAAQLLDRSLEISTSKASAEADYVFTFTWPATGTEIGSLKIEFCLNPVFGTACGEGQALESPAGLDVTGFTVDNFQIDGGVSVAANFTPANTTDNVADLTTASAETVASGDVVTFTLGGITNPSTDNQTFFARILVDDATTYAAHVHRGTVASSTASTIDITSIVKETLNFSVGSQWTAPTGCAALNDAGIQLGDSEGVLDTANTYTAYSYLRIDTNAVGGSVIQYLGDTLEDVDNPPESITAAGSAGNPVAATTGTEQFGLTIDNTEANMVGNEPDELSATADYTSNAAYVFVPNTATDLATSTSTIECDSMAVKYIANIASTTAAGVYTTEIAYIATPTF